MAYSIRTYGDPVLKTKAAPITDVDGKLVRLVDDMFTTLYESDLGIALAAPQIGVQKQVFVWDLDGEQQVIFNPEIVESDGEWVYDEGCLSIPGLYVEMVRPEDGADARASTSRATSSSARPTSSRRGCTSTSSTICTAC